jgi:isopenicillin-N epimerase
MGTGDFSAWLSVPESIRIIDTLLPGGWPAVMQRNSSLALAARNILCDTLEISPPCPDEMIGALAAVPLPNMTVADVRRVAGDQDALRSILSREHDIEVPVVTWPAPPRRLLRVSAQLYNSLPQYERLVEVLKKVLHSRGSK